MATAPTFAQYARSFEEQVLSMKKPATIATMRSHLRFFTHPDVLGRMEVTQIDRPAIQGLFARMHSEGLAPKTLRNRWSTLHLVLEQAHEDRLLLVVPSPKLPQNKRKAQPFYTVEQMREIIHCAPEPYGTFSSLLAETGVRIGEAVAVEECHLNLETNVLTIMQDVYRGQTDTTKTNSADRTLSISTPLAARLRAHLAKPGRKSRFLFQTRTGTPFWPNEAQKNLSLVMQDRGIPASGFHAWRRGNITYAGTVLGMPEPLLAERVGHRSPTITFGVYTQSLPGYDRPWAEKIGAALFAEGA